MQEALQGALLPQEGSSQGLPFERSSRTYVIKHAVLHCNLHQCQPNSGEGDDSNANVKRCSVSKKSSPAGPEKPGSWFAHQPR